MELKSRLKDSNVYSVYGNVNNILIENGKRVCSAVHPDYPEMLHDGRARGRKIHLDKGNGIHTVCNMLVDEYVPDDEHYQPCIVRNGKCKVCFSEVEK
ncbi:MAG: hypothetical protein ACW98D_20055 [Promethearchaeota archaeon]